MDWNAKKGRKTAKKKREKKTKKRITSPELGHIQSSLAGLVLKLTVGTVGKQVFNNLFTKINKILKKAYHNKTRRVDW